MTCEGKIVDRRSLKLKTCGKPGTTTRPAWRFGKQVGEPQVVHYDAHLCAGCAEGWDEAVYDGEVEAAGS